MGTNVELLIDDLIGREGGFTNHPADRGGPTNWGITQQVARAYGYAGDMRDLERDEAKAIYRKRYWDRPGFADVATRYPALAAELFDTGVNMGPPTAAKYLQRSLNVLNRQARDYGDVPTDGDIGPMTLAALDAYKRRRGDVGERVLFKAVDALQGARYIEIAEHSPSQEAFVFGWLRTRVGSED